MSARQMPIGRYFNHEIHEEHEDRTTQSPIPDPYPRYDPIRTVTPPVNRHTDGTSSMCLK